MEKEKHKWVTKTEYINMENDPDHHYIYEYEACEKCGKRKW